MGSADLLHQLRYACRAAGTLQALRINGYAAGVITPVLKPGQALHQNWDDVVIRNRADNATHE
jgi:hypothetical protein